MKVALASVLALVCLGCMQAVAVPGAEVTPDGCLLFSATGQAVAAKEDDALAMAEASLAACVIAKANLLETIKGAMVSSSVSVGDLMFRSQEAELKVQGFLARATVAVMPPEASRLGASPIVVAKAQLKLAPEEYATLEQFVE